MKPVQITSDVQLAAKRSVSNTRVLARLSQDANAEALLQTCHDDAALGRMAPPAPISLEAVDNAAAHLSPRFGVEQEKTDGTVKVRAVDDFTFSCLNANTAATEKLRCDGLDTLLKIMRLMVNKHGKVRFFTFTSPWGALLFASFARRWKSSKQTSTALSGGFRSRYAH